MTKSYLSSVANLVSGYFYISLISTVISFKNLQLDGKKGPANFSFEQCVHSARYIHTSQARRSMPKNEGGPPWVLARLKQSSSL